ncbi:MAG: hypothetical protein LQ349_006423 [Xanthoria aureola]|nr:MAG: hypothetical protein LQ349_006423 [Xanthoria aureola]
MAHAVCCNLSANLFCSTSSRASSGRLYSDNMMFDYVINQPAIRRRRNAVKPDDVEYLLSHQPGSRSRSKGQIPQGSSSSWRVPPPRKRSRSGEPSSAKEGTKPGSTSKILGPEDVAPMTLQQRRSQQTVGFKNELSSSLDSQSSHSVQEQPARKRKHATLDKNEDYYDLQLANFDVIHPSEIKLTEEDVDGNSIGATHESFPKQAHSHRQCSQHTPRPSISAADSPISANTSANLLFKCNANTTFTTCCMRGTETCGPDLLCHNVNGYLVARQYCTDPTWTTDQCSRLCPEFNEAGTVLTTCDDGSYCCGSRADDCCDAGRGYKINPSNGEIVIQSKTTSTSSSSSTSSTAAPATTSSTATAATAGAAQTGTNGALPSPIPPSSGLSGGAKAGIAIGAVAGVAIIAGLAFLLYRERRKRKALAESEKQPPRNNNGYGYGNIGGANMSQPQQQPMGPPTELGAYEGNEHKYHYHSELGDGQGRPSELHP